jgi:hypothetical protein
VEAVVLNPGAEDHLVWRWTAFGLYSTSSAHSAMFLGQSSILGAKELWKIKALGKCHFFFWSVLHGRTWTSDRLFRHGLRDDESCALCSQATEMVDHLLAGCVFNCEFRFKFFWRFGWQQLTSGSDSLIVDWWLQLRKMVAKSGRKAFDSAVLLGAWSLWLERNVRTFSSWYDSVVRAVMKAGEHLKLWCRAQLIGRLCLAM